MHSNHDIFAIYLLVSDMYQAFNIFWVDVIVFQLFIYMCFYKIILFIYRYETNYTLVKRLKILDLLFYFRLIYR